jgi:hypothetical protein
MAQNISADEKLAIVTILNAAQCILFESFDSEDENDEKTDTSRPRRRSHDAKISFYVERTIPGMANDLFKNILECLA